MTGSAARRGGGAAERRIIFGLFALSAVLFAIDRWPRAIDGPPLPTNAQMAAMESSYRNLLLDLLADAERAAENVRRTVAVPLDSVQARRSVFDELDRIGRTGGHTLVLVDPDDLAQAWGGPGLRHDLPLDRLLPGGINQTAGFTAVSLYAAVDMSTGEGGWRLIVGNSYPTDSLPFPVPFGLRRHDVRWSVRDHSAEPLTPALESLGIRELAPPDGVPGPWLRLRFAPAGEQSSTIGASLALVALVLAIGLSTVWLFRRWSGRAPAKPHRSAAILGLAGVAAVVSYGLFRWRILATDATGAPPDPGASFGGPVGDWVVLLAAWLVLAGISFWALGWPEGRDWLHVLMTATAAAVGVGLLAEATHRPALRALLADTVREGLDAPHPEEVAALAESTSAFLAATDLRMLALGDPRELDDRQDLALELWSRSPLAASEMVSALAVIGESGVSTFSYGLPVDPVTGSLDAASARWPSGDLPTWQQRRSALDVFSLGSAGQDWGTVRFWTAALPRVDVWTSTTSGAGAELQVRLLRGGPDRSRSAPVPSANAEVAYVDGAGRPLVSRWQEDWLLPPPSEAVDPRRTLKVETPAGPALAWFSPTDQPGLWIVALLPEETVAERLWRIATVATRLILAVSAVALAVLLISLPTAKLRRRLLPDIRRYSVRLTAVLALIAIVPLTLLNGLLFRNLAARVQAEQEAAGRTALVSLEYVLTDFLLGLEAGFSIDAQLDDELLAWLAEVVGHEVNLYWRGSVYASSKPDLFTAGLMPERIPGNVYSKLALLGHPTAARVQTTRQGTSYLELYTPVSLGEVRPGESGLFVSVPLLAQQEAATRALAALRRQALVVTTALVLLLVTVGARLARGFTHPLMRMIDGADRIAGGAASLGFAPRETELRTLAEAIDGMAVRIASARADLVRAQRLEAWAEMARLIAHEVKNPLTPIRLSTEHLRQVWRDAPDRLEEVFDRCTGNILAQVEELARTAGEFSTYSRIPLARPAPDDLAEAVREVVDGYGNTAHGEVAVVFESEPAAADAVLAFDRRLLQRALRNLIENALRASSGDGEVLVAVETCGPDGAVAVTVSDRGPGVSDSDLERIFEPYFSTSSGGTGLGLPIARRIVQEHGGSITAATRPGGGLAVRIVLPGGQSDESSSGADSN
ncbi:MAG: ATP-binding protein [Acidobacteriota bacterium]|nr:ATP-binding protein [Acidobacteriota bacterium]MDE3265250.1 ATP-binding protein [Acidobacteriota bacterium]